MSGVDHIQSHDAFAKTYDDQAKQYNSYVPDALFGMCYEFIKPGESLLDLGIGTGLSSINFARAGLEITGLDGSAEMMNECRKKGFAKALKQYDIRSVPLPYSDNTFSYIICCGVFHFFNDLQSIIKDVYRILKSKGIFAFTVASLTQKEAGTDYKDLPEYVEIQSVWGIPVFKHSDKYINKICEQSGFSVEKIQKVLVDSGDKDVGDLLFKIYVTKRLSK